MLAAVAGDGFEAGNFSGGTGQWQTGGWTVAGDASLVTSGQHTGSYHARLRSGTGDLQRSVDVSGLTDVKLQFWSKVSSFEGSDQARVQVSGNGSSWTTLQTFANGQDDNQYHFHQLAVPDLGSTLYVRFDAAMSATNDNWYLDDIAITATPTGPPSISIADVIAIEGDDSMRFVDVFVTPESGGLRNARGIEYGPDGNLYVSGESDPSNPIQLGFVNRYDGQTGAFIDVFASHPSMTGAKDVEFGPDGNLYVTNNVGDNVYRFDGATGAMMDVFIPAGSGGLNTPRQLIFGPDGNGDGVEDLYVVSALTDNILRYDGVTGAFLGEFVTAGSGGLNEPTAITFGPDGSLFVTSGAHQDFFNSILRYDGTSGQFLEVFVEAGSAGLTLAPTAGMILGPDVNGDGTPDLYVSNGEVDEILIYSGSDGSFLETFIPSGLGGLDDPKGLLFDNDGNLLVVNNGDHSVRRYGPASMAALVVSLSSLSANVVTVDFNTVDGTATAGSDYNPAGGTIVFAPGVTQRTILVPTLDDGAEESSETFDVVLSNAVGGVIADAVGVVTIIDDDTPPPQFGDDYAFSESTAKGNITSGSLSQMQVRDGLYEAIRETETGGKPSNRQSLLEHTWTFDVTGGDTVTFFVEAWHTANSEGDHFVFSYSTDGTNFTEMLTVTKTADNNAAQSFVLPAGISGVVYVRVTDTDQTPGNRSLDTLYVDHMFIRSESAAGAFFALLEEEDEETSILADESLTG